MTFLLVAVVYAVAIGKPSFNETGPLAVGFALWASAFVGRSVKSNPVDYIIKAIGKWTCMVFAALAWSHAYPCILPKGALLLAFQAIKLYCVVLLLSVTVGMWTSTVSVRPLCANSNVVHFAAGIVHSISSNLKHMLWLTLCWHTAMTQLYAVTQAVGQCCTIADT